MNDEAAPAAPPVRDRILSAAFGAFMELGYAKASTAEIARRAKVSKRDMYAAFGSKQVMLAACIAKRAEAMGTPLDLPVSQSRDALTDVLVAFGTHLLQEVSRPEVLAMYRLAVLEAERCPEVAHTLDTLGRRGSTAALATLLGTAQSRGLLPEADPLRMAELFLSVLWGGLLVRLLLGVAAVPDAADAAARARFATETLLGSHVPTA